MSDPLAGLDPATVLLHTLVSQLMMPHALAAAHLEAQQKMQLDHAMINALAHQHAQHQQQQQLLLNSTLQQQQLNQAAAAAAAAAAAVKYNANTAATTAPSPPTAAATINVPAPAASSTTTTTMKHHSHTSSSGYPSGSAASSSSSSSSSHNSSSGTAPSSSSSSSRGPCPCKDCLAGKPPPPPSSSSSSSAYNKNSASSSGAFGRSLSEQNRYSSATDSSSNVTSIGVLKQMNSSLSNSPPSTAAPAGNTGSSATSSNMSKSGTNGYSNSGSTSTFYPSSSSTSGNQQKGSSSATSSSYRSNSAGSMSSVSSSSTSSSYYPNRTGGANSTSYVNSSKSGYGYSTTLPPSLVQSTMVPAPSIGHISTEGESFVTPSPLLFPYSSSPTIQSVPQASLTNPQTSDSAAVGATTKPGLDAAAAMIVMSTSPALNAIDPGSIPSLDAFPPAASSGGARTIPTHSQTNGTEPRFHLHSPSTSPTFAFNQPSPSLPPVLMKNPLDLRAMSNSPLIGGASSNSNITRSVGIGGPSASHIGGTSSASHPSHSSSLLLSTPSASYLRATPSSPSSLVFSSFLKSPIIQPSNLGASATSGGKDATSNTSNSLLLNGSDIAKQHETIISLKAIAGATNNGGASHNDGSSAANSVPVQPVANGAVGSTSSGSATASAVVSPTNHSRSMASTSMASPNLSILNRLKTINQSTTDGATSTTGAEASTSANGGEISISVSTSTSTTPTNGASLTPTGPTNSSRATPSSSSLQSNLAISTSSTPTNASSIAVNNGSGGGSGSNMKRPGAPPAPLPPSDRKRPRDAYENGGGGNGPNTGVHTGSSGDPNDHANCVQCQAISAQKAAAAASAAAAAAAASAPTAPFLSNPYPSTPFSSSSAHPHAPLKSPLTLMPSSSFTPPIFPHSSIGMSGMGMLLLPSSNLLTPQPSPASRRNSIVGGVLSPNMRPLSSLSPAMRPLSVLSPAMRPLTSPNLSLPRTSSTSHASPALRPISGSPLTLRKDESGATIMNSPNPQALLCHQCGTHRPSNTIVFCCNAYKKKASFMKARNGSFAPHKLCTNKYCESCLLSHYTPDKVGSKNSESIINFPPLNKRHDINHNWECPSCRSICSCNVCGASPLLPLSEVNPLALSPAHTLAYAYVYMSQYLEDSMISPPTEAEASEAAAAVGLTNAATYAVATSPIIRPKSEPGAIAKQEQISQATLNLCHLPPSMADLTSDDEDDDEQMNGHSSVHAASNGAYRISRVSPSRALEGVKSPVLLSTRHDFSKSPSPFSSNGTSIIGGVKVVTPSFGPRPDHLAKFLAASKSPMIQAMHDSHTMPHVKLEPSFLSPMPPLAALPSFTPSPPPPAVTTHRHQPSLQEDHQMQGEVKQQEVIALTSTTSIALPSSTSMTASITSKKHPSGSTSLQSDSNATMSDNSSPHTVLTTTSTSGSHDDVAMVDANEAAIAAAATSSLTDVSPLITAFSPSTRSLIQQAHKRLEEEESLASDHTHDNTQQQKVTANGTQQPPPPQQVIV